MVYESTQHGQYLFLKIGILLLSSAQSTILTWIRTLDKTKYLPLLSVLLTSWVLVYL